ncbi:carbohydrate-binding protein [Accumulibacter sp.]|uniref:carbohydrate-binding protein n=1 Tax=Accumulibacter sp. TaxID=2053492 RepID=UPI0025F012AD|nr:carbohydrate-binding protein [Accumulibacter sp.]MCM8611089.1 carbohydrate-binding protein [Accumulibacter sp.]MCM8636203.1 carbohydrate-binding protein [Accumulibacter sp.]MCM8640602.1 carbohydrate-binding protein [Accumulibacter sp.]
MRKRLIADRQPEAAQAPADWLRLDELTEVEISSEDVAHPIESALLAAAGKGWRASLPGRQTIRLIFAQPQRLRLISLRFVETSRQRTQEYLLRWSGDGGASFHDIVRQQWNFDPREASTQTENHQVDLAAVGVLELIITPDIADPQAIASLAEMRLA